MTRVFESAGRCLGLCFLGIAILAGPFAIIPQLGAATALAGDFKVRSCHRGEAGVTASIDGWTFSPGWQQNGSSCPVGLGFDTSYRWERGISFSWSLGTDFRHYAWRFATPHHMSVVIEGGETATGISYSLAACATCAPFMAIPERSAGDPPLEIVDQPVPEPPYVPNEPRSLTVLASCHRSGPCDPAEPILLHDFELTYDDNTTPVIDIWKTSGVFDYWGWNRPGRETLSFTASDYDSGIAGSSFVLDVDSAEQSAPSLPCASEIPIFWTRTLPCPATWTSPDLSFDLTSAPDGTHSARYWLRDAAGNQTATMSLTARIDGTPPEAPAALTVEGQNDLGWISSSSAKATWLNTGETVETATASGLQQSARFDIDPTRSEQVDPPFQFTSISSIPALTPPEDGIWLASVWTVDNAGNESKRRRFLFGRDIDTPQAPVLSPNRWASRAELTAGSFQHWFPPENLAELESQVCHYKLKIGTDASITMDGATRVIGSATSYPIWPGTGEGISYLHLQAESCAGVKSAIAITPVMVDGVAPVVSLTGAPAEGWSATSPIVTINAEDASGSGVDRIEYSVDGGPVNEVRTITAQIAIAPGAHVLRYRAKDVAANVSDWSRKDIRVDVLAPDVWFEPFDRLRPTHLRVHALDTHSGPVSAEVEFRRTDPAAPASARRWRSLSGNVLSGPDQGRIVIDVSIPDTQLEPGLYEFRATALDRAGNVSTGGTFWPGGSPVRLVLPLREVVAIDARIATIARRCKHGKRTCANSNVILRRRALRARRIDLNERVVIVGELRRRTGEPLPGMAIKIFGHPRYGSAMLMATVTSDARGRFDLAIGRGPSRTFTARFNGSEQIAPVEQSSTLQVRSGVTLKVIPRRVPVGRPVRFDGQLTAGLGYVPSEGKQIDIEFYDPTAGTWKIAEHLESDTSGRFTGDYTFKKMLDQPIRVRFRATVTRESGWPYETGSSPPRTLTVSP